MFHLQLFRNKRLKITVPLKTHTWPKGTYTYKVILFRAHIPLRKKSVFFWWGRIRAFLTYHQREHIKIHRAVVV